MRKLLTWTKFFQALGVMVIVAFVTLLVVYLSSDDFEEYVEDIADSWWSARSDQNWTDRQQTWFYNASQGSQLIDYKWMLSLEQPNNDTLFLDDDHMDDLRFITRGFDKDDPDRVDHLPVGFAKDVSKDINTKDRKISLGLTCAACHTNELEYTDDAGTTHKIRIDGGGTLANGPLLAQRIAESVTNTVGDTAKFDRFANRVLGSSANGTPKDELFGKLTAYMLERQQAERSTSGSTTTIEGYGRFDAFGRIFNQALSKVGAGDHNFSPINAPVSFPFLWGTNQSDFVQWVGIAGNGGVGPLGRNAGEVLGVFADINVTPPAFPFGYANSVNASNLIRLEQRIRKLRSPVWDEALPPIDVESAARGADIFVKSFNGERSCSICHNLVDRTDEDRKVTAWMEKLSSIGTDPTTANNISNPATRRMGDTGILKGRKLVPFGKVEFSSKAPVMEIVTHEVANMLLQRPFALAEQELISYFESRLSQMERKGNWVRNLGDPKTTDPDKFAFLAYKGRSLGGIWATAPFLHNGSVPTLWELLTVPEKRTNNFYVGSRGFDPVNVGIKVDERAPFSYEFRTHDLDGNPITGNSNGGHIYGTSLRPHQKWDLIEYMKTAMSP